MSDMSVLFVLGNILRVSNSFDQEETPRHASYYLDPNCLVCGVDYPRDIVILHKLPKGDFAPSLSHFVMKLETYLRITKIPYESDYGSDMGPKHKKPWIEYNGEAMGDSQLIINFLNKEFNVDLNQSLNQEERAKAWAIQKWMEEFTYHLNYYTRGYLLYADMANFIPSVPKYLMPIYSRGVRKMQYMVGTARHTKEEVHQMMIFDLRQLSNILCDRKFIMGGEPTEVDCAVFGILSQVRWHTPDTCPGKQVLMGELANLVAFTDRIKQLYWPDWDENTLAGTKKT